jgi:hypothetical protein
MKSRLEASEPAVKDELDPRNMRLFKIAAEDLASKKQRRKA